MKFVILHGTSSNHSSNWFPWLKEQLEKKGHSVWVPDLPNSQKPDIAAYNDFLLKSGQDFEDSVMIGHSSGSVAVSGLLQVLPESVNINTAILVGTFRGDMGWDSLHGVNIPFDYEKIKSKAKQFIVIHSDDDPNCPLDGAKYVAKQLGAEFVLLPKMKHFSFQLDPRFSQFPELLDIINKKVLAG